MHIFLKGNTFVVFHLCSCHSNRLESCSRIREREGGYGDDLQAKICGKRSVLLEITPLHGKTLNHRYYVFIIMIKKRGFYGDVIILCISC